MQWVSIQLLWISIISNNQTTRYSTRSSHNFIFSSLSLSSLHTSFRDYDFAFGSDHTHCVLLSLFYSTHLSLSPSLCLFLTPLFFNCLSLPLLAAFFFVALVPLFSSPSLSLCLSLSLSLFYITAVLGAGFCSPPCLKPKSSIDEQVPITHSFIHSFIH